MNWTSAYIQAVATLSPRYVNFLQLDRGNNHSEHHLWNDSNFEGPLVAFYAYFEVELESWLDQLKTSEAWKYAQQQQQQQFTRDA